MPSAQAYSSYAARQFASGRITSDVVQSLVEQLPLSHNTITQLIRSIHPRITMPSMPLALRCAWRGCTSCWR